MATSILTADVGIPPEPDSLGVETSPDVGRLFDQLAADWQDATEFTSNQREVLMHPAHLQIIGLGRDALPFIFDDVRRGGGPWFLALASITRADPVRPAHRTDAKAIRDDWVAWGKAHGYLPA